MSDVVYEGPMLRIGWSLIVFPFIHMPFSPLLLCLFPMAFSQNLPLIPTLYFVLMTGVLACYESRPLGNMVPIKTLFIDGNCRVKDKGRKIYRGHVVYVLSVYNRKDKYHRIMMAAFKIREVEFWKEKIESMIDQAKAGVNADGNASSSNRENLASAEDEEVTNRTMILRTTIDNDETHTVPNIPVMMSISSGSVSSKKGGESHENFNKSIPLDEESDEYQDCQSQESEEMMDSVMAENAMKQPDEDPLDQPDLSSFSVIQSQEPEEMMDSVMAKNAMKQPDEDPLDQPYLSSFSGNLQHDDRDNIRDCWRMLDGNNFKVRSKTFFYDKTKIPAGKPLMTLVAVDWFTDVKRMGHVARRQGCAVQVASEKGLFTLVVNGQVPGSTHYSMVFYFVSKPLVSGSLLQHFVDGDDEFRNSRFKLIPSVREGTLMVRAFVRNSPFLLGKAVNCTYIRGPQYLEIDIDLGSSTVLKRVFGAITTLVVDMAFLIQANTSEELPERLIGAVRVSHLELSSAIVPQLEPSTSTE